MASLGSKRSRDWEVSEIEEGKAANVHGIPSNVSPARESRSSKGVYYFDAKLSDGKKCVRVVSFDTAHLNQMKEAAESQSVVALSNSVIKKSSFSSELEIHLNKRSKVIGSPRKISFEGSIVPTAKTIKLADLVDATINQAIEVNCKIVRACDVEAVKKSDGKELRKQDIVVGDESGTCRLVAWEDDVDKLEEGKSYCLSNLVVRRYGISKYLSYTSQSQKNLIEDIEEVNNEDVMGEETEERGHFVKGEVSAVISCAEYTSCKFCKSKVVSEDGLLGECSKCGAMMKLSCCEQTKSAKFVVKAHDSSREITLSAFEPILSRIVDGESGRNISVKLLMAPSKLFRFNDKNVVFSVQNNT